MLIQSCSLGGAGRGARLDGGDAADDLAQRGPQENLVHGHEPASERIESGEAPGRSHTSTQRSVYGMFYFCSLAHRKQGVSEQDLPAALGELEVDELVVHGGELGSADNAAHQNKISLGCWVACALYLIASKLYIV